MNLKGLKYFKVAHVNVKTAKQALIVSVKLLTFNHVIKIRVLTGLTGQNSDLVPKTAAAARRLEIASVTLA